MVTKREIAKEILQRCREQESHWVNCRNGGNQEQLWFVHSEKNLINWIAKRLEND